MNATLRTSFIIAIILTVALVAFTIRATGSNRELIRYTGKWSGGFTVDSVVSGLGEFVERKGETVLVARLREAGGQSTLTCMYPAEAGRTAGKSEVSLRFDLRAPAARDVLTQWREQVLPGAGLTFFLAPPLRESLDAALLASLCDGLIMVAVAAETPRTALAAAAERLRLVNAATLGVVVNDGRETNPAWLRRLLGQ